jgi:hypothetical protein
MKQVTNAVLITAFLFCLLNCNKAENQCKKIEIPTKQTVPEESQTRKLSEWQIFTLALIEVVSWNNPGAVGKKNDGGVLQITPIYVKEANRIQKKQTFTLEDRFDIKKSLEMFNVIQSHYNKSRNIEKAIKLHNSHAPESYRTKILKKMEEISKREVVRNQCINYCL